MSQLSNDVRLCDKFATRVWVLEAVSQSKRGFQFTVRARTLGGEYLGDKRGRILELETDKMHRRLYSGLAGPIVTLFRWKIFVTQPDLIPDHFMGAHEWVLVRRNVRVGPLLYDRWMCLVCKEERELAPGQDHPGGSCLGRLDFRRFASYEL